MGLQLCLPRTPQLLHRRHQHRHPSDLSYLLKSGMRHPRTKGIPGAPKNQFHCVSRVVNREKIFGPEAINAGRRSVGEVCPRRTPCRAGRDFPLAGKIADRLNRPHVVTHVHPRSLRPMASGLRRVPGRHRRRACILGGRARGSAALGGCHRSRSGSERPSANLLHSGSIQSWRFPTTANGWLCAARAMPSNCDLCPS